MKDQTFVFVALLALAHCGGQAATGSSIGEPDASSSSSGGGSSGGSSGGGSSSGSSSGGGSTSGGSSGSGSSSGGSSSGTSSGGSSSGGLADAGCLGLSQFDGGPRTPSEHRALATACAPSSAHLPCEIVDGGGGQACTTDADCAGDGSYNPYSSCLRGHCGIDKCLSDSDCSSTEVCSCSSAYYGGNACYHPNLCVPANCHVDSDCGSGGFCSPTAGVCGTVEGFYCHKPTDPCVVPTDCGGTSLSSCSYSTAVGAFCCSPTTVCAG
jgi:hypothetical protein